jgi:hypothetical protein
MLVDPRVVLGPRSLVRFHVVCDTSLVGRVVGVIQPPRHPVLPEAGGTARAAEAMATNITAMSAATVANDKMRFISIPFPLRRGALC